MVPLWLPPLRIRHGDLLEYLESGEPDEIIEAWMRNPVGPVPWSESRD